MLLPYCLLYWSCDGELTMRFIVTTSGVSLFGDWSVRFSVGIGRKGGGRKGSGAGISAEVLDYSEGATSFPSRFDLGPICGIWFGKLWQGVGLYRLFRGLSWVWVLDWEVKFDV